MSSVLVPTSLLLQRIDLRPLEGEGADGPVMGDWVTGVRARVVGRRRVVRSGGGNDRTSTQTAIVRPKNVVAPESQARFDGDTYEVAEVIPMEGLRGPAGYELVLV